MSLALDVQNKLVRIWNCMTLVYDIIMHFVRISNRLHKFSCGLSPFFFFLTFGNRSDSDKLVCPLFNLTKMLSFI